MVFTMVLKKYGGGVVFINEFFKFDFIFFIVSEQFPDTMLFFKRTNNISYGYPLW